ncbi:MAG: hypothetical protein SGJ18_01635 [Pseudomonadota bacterium]|nr:hypothetical protein [Pseudomonadota bacterium]
MKKNISVVLFLLFFSNLAGALCVSASKAVLRSGPGTQFRETWSVGKFMPLKFKSKRGSWFEVSDLDGKSHWVFSGVVTEDFSCVAVKVPYVVLRQGPGEGSLPAAFKIADKYFPYKKLRREDNWIELEDDFGDQYWVKDSFVWWPVSYAKVSF